jgi:tetratricopeptide (TPR) repeat protein
LIDSPGARFDGELCFSLARGGELRGLAGWFEAELAPGIVLSTAPGIDTHWGQYLFPLPATAVVEGHAVRVRLTLVEEAGDAEWRWSGEVAGEPFAHRSTQRLDEEPLPPGGMNIHSALGPSHGMNVHSAPGGRERLLDLNRRGAEAFGAGRLREAAAAWEEAVFALGPDEIDLAPALHENLGLAYYNLGRDAPALRSFLRALDGDPASREQSLRFLVHCSNRCGRLADARRFRAAYERAFGPLRSR